MGEHTNNGLPVSFDGRLRLAFHGTRLTSDAGLLVYRELDETVELTEMASGRLHDWRRVLEPIVARWRTTWAIRLRRTHQDRCEVRNSRSARDLPDGRGGRAA